MKSAAWRRITSYNVCYTKLLRQLFVARETADAEVDDLDPLGGLGRHRRDQVHVLRLEVEVQQGAAVGEGVRLASYNFV